MIGKFAICALMTFSAFPALAQQPDDALDRAEDPAITVCEAVTRGQAEPPVNYRRNTAIIEENLVVIGYDHDVDDENKTSHYTCTFLLSPRQHWVFYKPASDAVRECSELMATIPNPSHSALAPCQEIISAHIDERTRFDREVFMSLIEQGLATIPATDTTLSEPVQN